MKANERMLHVDADAFFASCEEILSPALRGRALIVAGGRRQSGLVELRKLLAQLRRERLAPREIFVAVRFADFTEVAARHRFRAAQEHDEIIYETFAAKFSECVGGHTKFIRQLRLALGSLSPIAARQEVFRNFL